MMMINLYLGCLIAAFCHGTPFSALSGLTDFELRQMLARIGSNLVDYEEVPSRRMNSPLLSNVPQELMPEMSVAMSAPVDYDEFSLTPSLRDREYLTHSTLLGNGQQYQKLHVNQQQAKPTGVKPNSEIKGDGVLPAYCNPPNPCPIGYTEKDGCIEDFENTAAFSRDYQSLQECMCDTEHMFRCPDSSRDSAITALARSIQNEGGFGATLDKIEAELRNPYLEGEKLPIAAKKGMNWI